MSTITDKSNTRKSVRDASADDVAKSSGGDIAAGRKAIHGASQPSGQAARRVVEATSRDVIRKNAEAVEQNLHKATGNLTGNVVDAARRMNGRTNEQLGKLSALQEETSKEVAGRAQQGLDVTIQSGVELADSYQSIMGEWADYTRNAMQCNIDGLNRIMRVRTPQDFMAAQSELLNAQIRIMLDSNVKILEAGLCVARGAAQRALSTQG